MTEELRSRPSEDGLRSESTEEYARRLFASHIGETAGAQALERYDALGQRIAELGDRIRELEES